MKRSFSVAGLVLAAGKGKRMKSDLPKVLHPVAGKPMLGWVLEQLAKANIEDCCVVVAPNQNETLDFLKKFPNVAVAVQPVARGTGDAVASSSDFFREAIKPKYSSGTLTKGNPSPAQYVIVLTGDIPGVQSETIDRVLNNADQYDVTIAGMTVDPTGYGRIILGENGSVEKIVEDRDATVDQKSIRLCNTGVICARVTSLFTLLDEIKPNNNQGEYYLTDCVELAHKRGMRTRVVAFNEKDSTQFLGINDPTQLQEVESLMIRRMKGN